MIAAFPFGPLAQSVEQLAFNQLVPRSSRGRPTKNAASSQEVAFFWPKGKPLTHRFS